MYEPIRTKSVHTMAAAPEIPHRSREEELDIRLAGQLTALLTVTDELHALATRADGGAADAPASDGAALAAAAELIAEQVARLSGGHYPLRAEPTDGTAATRTGALHQRAHTLAGNALAVATARNDTAVMALAADRLAAHAAPLRDLATA
ncbi:SCO4983 family protein [Streptomyces sioyaensis]|uniref:SCO4983 family protein n=1 Tax=Streptomyces sioyaensis TaxID=67364 RepID=UPI0037B89607